MFSVEHASSTGPAVMEEGRRGATGFLFSSLIPGETGYEAACLVAKLSLGTG